MAISTNGGSNPTQVIYNGKNCTEVWFKSSPSAEAVKVWPDDIYFTWVGLQRDVNENFFPDHIYVKTNANATPWTDDLTAQHAGGDKALIHDFTTKPGVGFDFSTYGEWAVNSVSIMVNKPTKGPVDKWYEQTVTGNRNTLAKAIKVTYENGAFWLKNVQTQPINLTKDLPSIMGPIEKFTAIEFDIGLYAHNHGSDPGMEIRFYFKDWEPEPEPEPEPTPYDGYAFLTMNHWPSLSDLGDNMMGFNPSWTFQKQISSDNPDSRYFKSPSKVPFTQEIYPITNKSNWVLKYWTLTYPNGTVKKYTDTNSHSFTFSAEGEYKVESFWEEVPEPTPLGDIKLYVSVDGMPRWNTVVSRDEGIIYEWTTTNNVGYIAVSSTTSRGQPINPLERIQLRIESNNLRVYLPRTGKYVGTINNVNTIKSIVIDRHTEYISGPQYPYWEDFYHISVRR